MTAFMHRTFQLAVTVIVAFFVTVFPVGVALAKKPNCNTDPSHPSCSDDGGGGSGGAAAPVFAYRRDGGSAAKIYLANADGSEATHVFTGVKFSRTGEPAVHGDSNGGTLLIETFRNLHRIVYEVDGGVITVLENIKILDRGDDDSGLSILAPQPQWSPDGADFVYKNGAVNPSGTDMYLYLRATSDPATQAITDFGDPIYSGRREACPPDPNKPNMKCPAIHDIGWLAWDESDTIHFTVRKKDDHSWELRSFKISDCESAGGTCEVGNTTCIASTSTCGLPLGATSFSHVSASYENGDVCTGGTAPRILLAGDDANGDAQTFVLDGLVPTAPTANIPGLNGQDWTPNCTILGTVGDSVVEHDPYAAAGSTTLVGRNGSVPDWTN